MLRGLCAVLARHGARPEDTENAKMLLDHTPLPLEAYVLHARKAR
ncbi:hypothetical protein ACFVX6_28800 [Streptomyces sp. NPDC058289]